MENIKSYRANISEKVIDNIELNKKEIKEKRSVLKSYPVKLYVEPNQNCNLSCISCDPVRRSENNMTRALLDDIERELFSHAAEVNFFLAGEPTLFDDLPYMLSKTKAHTFLPKIFTNAMILKEEQLAAFADNGVFVNVSIDAANKSLYEKIRKGASYDLLIENIKKLVAARENAHSRFHVRFASTIATYNIDEVSRLVDLASSLGVNDIMFGSYDGWFLNERMLCYKPKQALSSFLDAKKNADKKKIRFSCPKRFGNKLIRVNNNWQDFELPIDSYAPFYLENMNPYRGDCAYPWHQTVVRADGTVVTCCQNRQEVKKFEKNFHETVWNSKEYQDIRNQSSFHLCKGQPCNMSYYSIHQAMPRRTTAIWDSLRRIKERKILRNEKANKKYKEKYFSY